MPREKKQKLRLREVFQPTITRHAVIVKQHKPRIARHDRSVSLFCYCSGGRRKVVILHRVPARTCLADHSELLAQHGIRERPAFGILQTAGRLWVDSDAWETVSWRQSFSVPNVPRKPIFVNATNDPLPDGWEREVSRYLDVL
ncbi:hypothetical protein BDZ89DRAFT_1130282 [Hymenopellis radicata]|nr:hypothetical protein BDZ89DRAFT_1130282 [Hymenopellis radicata]